MFHLLLETDAKCCVPTATLSLKSNRYRLMNELNLTMERRQEMSLSDSTSGLVSSALSMLIIIIIIVIIIRL